MKKLQLRTEGLEGDMLSFATKLNERFSELEIVDKTVVATEIRSAMKDFLGEDGALKFDVSKLTEMLGDGDKGVRSILKKQGEAIEALKDTTKGEGKTFKTELQARMKDLQKVMQAKEGDIKLNLRAAAIMNTGNVIDGYEALPDDLIESFSVSAFVEKRRPREYVFDIASRTTVAAIEQYKTWMEEGADEGAFALVEEGALKPLVSKKLVRNHSEYSKVAAKYVVTEEFTKFRREAYNIIKRLISQKLLRDYAAILTARLIADSVPYTASALDGQFPADTITDYHAIAAVAAQIEGLDFEPDVLIMNPQDKWRIGMSQDTVGQFYLTIPVTDPSGQTRMMGFTLRTSNRMPVGSFMLGESGLWNIEDESLTVRIGYGLEVIKNVGGDVIDVEGDLDHNRMRVIVENYFHSWIGTNNTGSFVMAQFATVKAVLVAPVAP